jgi:XTP/dITP diphosphohydrolase
MQRTLYLATKNLGKVNAFNTAFQLPNVQLQPCPPGLALPPEIHEDYAGNAMDKAMTVATSTQCPALGDDSGLEILAWDRHPGVQTAPVVAAAGGWPALIAQLANDAGFAANPRAEAVCVLALAFPPSWNLAPLLVEERVAGRMILTPRGPYGFGFDPYYIADGQAQTLGENLTPSLTARGRAAQRIQQQLQSMLANNQQLSQQWG